MSELRYLSIPKKGKYSAGYRIETMHGCVYVRTGKRDEAGREAEVIEIVPDSFSGDPPIVLVGSRINHLIVDTPENPYTPPATPCPRFYQHMSAPRDHNGNPRRLFVVYELQTVVAAIVAVYDEGYAGLPADIRKLPAIEEVDISLADYRRITREAEKNGYMHW